MGLLFLKENLNLLFYKLIILLFLRHWYSSYHTKPHSNFHIFSSFLKNEKWEI